MKTANAISDRFYYMDDFKPGDIFTAGPVTVTAQEIIEYAKQFDPQDFHVDPEKALATTFGEHVASGWHTASLSMRLMLEAVPPIKGGMVGRQIEKMGWPRPVRPGDALSLDFEVLSLRPSASNPKRGVMHARCTTKNQKGETVMEMEPIILLPRKA